MNSGSSPRRPGLAVGAIVAGTLLAMALAGCATATPAGSNNSGNGKIEVVAAENFWGSIAAQLGGTYANVTSILSNPDTDPHSYEASPADGRTVTTARYVIVNGVGYDPWASKLLATDADRSRAVLNVGDLVGVKAGENPHLWYSPAIVRQVIERITSDYQKIDPTDAAYFAARKQNFETTALGPYNQLITDIKSKYAGTPIGASESIIAPLASGLGLNLLTPQSFLNATSEGDDPTAADKATIDAQLSGKLVKIYIYNSQNSTPDVQAQVTEAKTAGIPVTTVTETLAPANSTFQDWQVAQLRSIEAALAAATGK